MWGDDQPAIPIQATFVQHKGKFTDKKLQLTLHSQVQAPLAMTPVHRWLVCWTFAVAPVSNSWLVV